MAMLAERRRKNKWALNPRGKLWSDDSNKFGQKILEKMGWSSGKGLGVNESGITEHIKVSYKNDSQGIGYKDKGDQWTQHEDQFNNLLSSLNGDSNEGKDEPEERISGLGFGYKEEKPEKKPKPAIELSGESLEEKSKNSKARVHYKKFTRGKDISKYSEKDLANIFGKKSMVEKSEEPTETAPALNYGIVKPQSETELEKSETKEKDTTFGITTLESKMSIADYFKSKMPKLASKSKKFVVGPDGVLKSVKEDENDVAQQELEDNRVSFKLENAENTNNDCKEVPLKHKKSKKSRIEEDQVQTCNGDDEHISEESNDKENVVTENLESLLVSKSKKKKKSRKQVTESDEQQNIANNDIVENSNANPELQNDIDSAVKKDMVSKKSKKVRIANSLNHEQDSVQENLDNADNKKQCKKNKKKRKHDMIEEDKIESISIQENAEVLENVNNENQVSEPKKKKQKNSNKTDSPMEVENAIEPKVVQNDESSTDLQTENPVNEGEEVPKHIENGIEQNSESTKKKKKKSRKYEQQMVPGSADTDLVTVEEPAIEHLEKISSEVNNSVDEGGLKKKKKRKNKVDVEETNTELTNELEKSPSDQNLADVSKPKKKKRAQKNAEVHESNMAESLENVLDVDHIVVNGNDESKIKNQKKKLAKKSDDQTNEIANSANSKPANESQNHEVSNKKTEKNSNKLKPRNDFLGEKNIKQKIREAQVRGEEILLENAFAGANIFEIPGYGVPSKPGQ